MPGDRGQARIGLERKEGVPGPQLRTVPLDTETIEVARTYETNPNKDPSGNERQGEILKAEGAFKIRAAADSESWLTTRISHRGYAGPGKTFFEESTPTVGVRKRILRDYDEMNDTPLDFYSDSLFGGVWRDELTNPAEFQFRGLKIEEFTVGVDANKYVFFEHSGPFLRDTYMKKPDTIVDNVAFQGHLVSDGHRAAGDENGDFYKFKVIVGGDLDGGAPIPTIQWGKGAGAYAGPTYPVVPNDWMYAHNVDGTIAGTPREPIRIMFVADPLTDALVAGQEWRIVAAAPRPIPIFTARPLLSAPACEIRFSKNGGTTWFTKVIEGAFSLKYVWPREMKFGLGSVYGLRIGRPDQAQRWAEFSWNGTYEDLDLTQAQISGIIFSISARFDGDPIGSTGLKDYAKYEAMNLRVTKAGATIQNAGDLPENPTLRAFSVDGSQICTEEYQNTILSVTPVEDVS